MSGNHTHVGNQQIATFVIYSPNEHAGDYIIFIDDQAEYEQWKTDKSIAMSRFLGVFSIYKSGTSGHTGQLGEVSKQEIENVFFGDDKNVKDKSVEAAIAIILQNGTVQPGNLNHHGKATKNPARGSGDVRPGGGGQGGR